VAQTAADTQLTVNALTISTFTKFPNEVQLANPEIVCLPKSASGASLGLRRKVVGVLHQHKGVVELRASQVGVPG
jgi:hypothetical protein